MSIVKRRFPVVLLILLTVAAMLFYLWQQQADEQGDRLLLYGNVDIREVQLAFRQPGHLQILNFDEGDRVAEGTLLAELDAQPYREALAVARDAQANHQHQQVLVKDGAAHT